jgi:hypothetical protein
MSKTTKQVITIAFFIIVDYILIWLWVKEMDPDPSISIGLLILLPFVSALNLIIALLLYFMKRKYAVHFIINAIITPFLMFYLFNKGISSNLDNTYEEWSFKIADTTFNILREKKIKDFNMSYSNTEGSSTGFLDGKYKETKEGYLLTTDSTKYIIKNNFLFGFRKRGDGIKLTKTEY